MSRGQAFYQNAEGLTLSLFIDVDLNSTVIQDLQVKGSLLPQYIHEVDELKNLVINRQLVEAQNILRNSLRQEVCLKNENRGLAALSWWLFYHAIEDYLGTDSRLKEQNDLLCLCYGVGKKELKKQILKRSDYDLTKLIAETMATAACGQCKNQIEQAMVNIRADHGIIWGLDHSQSRLDKDGRWVKIKGFYPADLLIYLDQLKKIWMKREGIEDQFVIEIVKIEGHHLWLTVSPGEESARSLKILAALSDYWHFEMKALFILHLVV